MSLGANTAIGLPKAERTGAESNGWTTHGKDAAERRFSPLTQINVKNAGRLGLVWTYDLQSTRGVEATPLVVNNVMYVTAPWSIVHAVDARTGKRVWSFDPEVKRREGYKACCDVVNRGVAYDNGKVFVGTVDGRLIALNASNGQKIWEQDTVYDHQRSITITGAPRVYHGKVIIGNGGSEYGVRGYVTAYNAENGSQMWRWYTVPGDPSKPFENDAMAQASKTWDPSGKYWVTGGGGTVWDSMAYDPELNLLYVGTDNGAPWSYHVRSPNGGDNLYLCSIVALNLDSGQYQWHYQETPGDSWDFSATQNLILADLSLGDKMRKVILHAPKNGFFFVIDRKTGEFISTKNYVDVNWTSGYSAAGKPMILPSVRESDQPYDIVPGPFGAHNWQPMSWSPITGLAYIPAQNVPVTLQDDKRWRGYGTNLPGEPHSGVGWNTAMSINAKTPTSKPFGRLIAWDPVKQETRWSVEYVSPFNGGTLATAGNLIFQGSADGRFIAYNASTGAKLWESPTGTGVVAAPITYAVRGKQYVSVAVGWGGIFGLSARATDRKTPGTVYTFALDGKEKLPEFVNYQLGNLLSGVAYKTEDVVAGTGLYVSNCVFCHGVPGVDKGGAIRNLGYVPREIVENLDRYVFNGPFVNNGMPDFTNKLSIEEVEKIKAFIQGTADAIRPNPNKN